MKKTLNTKYLLVLIITLLPNLLKAQSDTLKLNKCFIGKCLNDSRRLVTAPFHWNQQDWKIAGMFVAGTAALTLADQPLADWVTEHRTDAFGKVSENFIGPLGAEYGIALIAGFFAHGFIAGNDKSMSTSLLAGESLALATLFVYIPKELFGRWRPDHYPEASAFDWRGPFNGNSFPSGHTIAAFSIASVIATQYRETKWVPIASYSLASLVGLSRIYDNRHWLSDVAAGAVLGTLIGKMVCRTKSESRLSVAPYGNANYQGIYMAIAL